MINLQIINRGISNSDIISAFCQTNKENFIPKPYAKNAYIDMEISSFQNNKSILRAFVLAKIAQVAIDVQPKTILIVGDFFGYTSAIFSKFCEKCHICAILKQDYHTIEKSLIPDISICFLEDISNDETQNFDFILFDSGFYMRSTIKQILSTNLASNGSAIFLTRQSSSDFFEKQFSFTNTTIVKHTAEKQEQILKMSLLLPTYNII